MGLRRVTLKNNGIHILIIESEHFHHVKDVHLPNIFYLFFFKSFYFISYAASKSFNRVCVVLTRSLSEWSYCLEGCPWKHLSQVPGEARKDSKNEWNHTNETRNSKDRSPAFQVELKDGDRNENKGSAPKFDVLGCLFCFCFFKLKTVGWERKD